MPPDGRPWALFALTGVSLMTNVVLAIRLATAGTAPPVVAVVDDVALEAVEAVAVVAPPPEATPPVAPTNVVRAPVTGSIAATFAEAAPTHADVLTQVYNRLFMWDLDVTRDLQKGDVIEVAYEWDGTMAEIPVAAYTSRKHGRRLVAYRFQATGDASPSWWDAAGVEVPYRLVDGPISAYEQVTSLVRDGRGHKGMDFKAPEGTPVVTPKAASVLRTNWNHGANGNCVEVRYEDGATARFLHLSRTDVEAGQRVAAGVTLGLSGNTGRSTAPHLHYEVERGGRIVDPRVYHGTERRRLAETDLAAFEMARAGLDAMLQIEAVASVDP
jgi:murein DD-endopeptidase MepM/ murein hydrolase activator NlpD